MSHFGKKQKLFFLLGLFSLGLVACITEQTTSTEDANLSSPTPNISTPIVVNTPTETSAQIIFTPTLPPTLTPLPSATTTPGPESLLPSPATESSENIMLEISFKSESEIHDAKISQISFSPDGKWFITSSPYSFDVVINFWDGASGISTLNYPVLSPDFFAAPYSRVAAFYPTGEKVAIAFQSFDYDQTQLVIANFFELEFASVDEFQEVFGIEKEGIVDIISISPDQTKIAIGYENGDLIIFDTDAENIIAEFNTHTGVLGFNQVQWSPDNSKILTVPDLGENNDLAIWDATTGEAVHILSDSRSLEGFYWVNAASWSPDGSLLAIGSIDDASMIIDGNTFQEITNLKGTFDILSALSWSPDGQYIAGGDWSGNISIWDAASGKRIDELNMHDSSISALAWSPDGTRIVSGYDDGKVITWAVDGVNNQEVGNVEPLGQVDPLVFPTREVTKTPDERTISDVIFASDNLSNLQLALEATEFADLLSGEEEFTLLAPYDPGILAPGSGRWWEIAPGFEFATQRVSDHIAYHIIPGRHSIYDLHLMGRVQTLQGGYLDFSGSCGGGYMVSQGNEFGAWFTSVDIQARNGVVHTISDPLLIPEQSSNLYPGLEDVSAETREEIIQIAKALQDLPDGVSVARLTDGRFLFSGGLPDYQTAVADTYLYDPVTGQASQTAPMNYARYRHKVVVLSDGTVLALGGDTRFESSNTGERYDPVTERWTNVSSPPINLGEFSAAVLLQDGRVFVSNGSGSAIYNPEEDVWVEIAKMNESRLYHSATLLPDGNVFVVGNYYTSSNRSPVNYTAETYNLESDSWHFVAPPLFPHTDHNAILLGNGNILVTGGRNDYYEGDSFAEIYDPSDDTWTEVTSMPCSGYLHSSFELAGGAVVMLRGKQEPLLYFPQRDFWTALNSSN